MLCVLVSKRLLHTLSTQNNADYFEFSEKIKLKQAISNFSEKLRLVWSFSIKFCCLLLKTFFFRKYNKTHFIFSLNLFEIFCSKSYQKLNLTKLN